MDKQYTFKRISSRSSPDEFYIKLGPFFTSRMIRKEFDNYPLSNEDDWFWYIAEEHGKVIGFIAIEPFKATYRISASYVVPEKRRQGVYRRLLDFLTSDHNHYNKPLTAAIRREQRRLFEEFGFVSIRSKGMRWISMRRECGDEKTVHR